MQQANILSVPATLPISVNPSSSEIVFCPETNSYSLSLGVTVQLPIHELVEVLLKFNAEHVVPNSVSDAESSNSQSLLASMPEASPFTLPDSSVYTPKVSDMPKKICRESKFDDDDFMQIPITVARQDPILLDYKERAKWQREFGRFFVESAFRKQEERMDRFTKSLQRYDELPVAEEFSSSSHSGAYYEQAAYDYVEAKPLGGKRLSADAPEFTPGSAFASTYASDSVKERALSETFAEAARGDRDRAMSNLSYLPPNAVINEEEVDAAVESSAVASFWKHVVANNVVPMESLERDESRPAECKQM
jgi:hypothetical protein